MHTINDVALGTTAFIELLGAAVLVAIVAERIRLPAAVALVGFGAIVSSAAPLELPFRFGPALLFVFLPPLIFEAAWNLDAGALRRMAWPIAVLAAPGVLLTSGVIAFGLFLGGQLPLVAAFMFGAIVSATDPVAVIAIFRRLSVPLDLVTLVEGESIANDGVAIALYGVALALAASPATFDLWGLSFRATVGVFGGVAVGVAAAAIIGLAIRGARDRSVELTATIVLAFTAYGVANSLGFSGVFASAAAGVTLRAMRGFVLTAQAPEDIDRFWEVIAFVANAVVFLATGLLLQIQRILHEPLLVLTAIVVVAASRALLVFGVLPAFGVGRLRPGWRLTAFFAGMRGALSLALALGLPRSFPHADQIVDATFAIVLVTLVLQGATIEGLLRRLQLASETRVAASSSMLLRSRIQ
jgi:CPA1 family monovalent cation:H+ antiporter